MRKPILSICIPTANRSDYLEKAIESVVHQKPFLNGEVEIVISDNSEDDKTEDICSRYRNPRIKYYKNKENIHGLNYAQSLSLGLFAEKLFTGY